MGTKASSSDDSGGRSAVELGAWLVWPAIVATPLVAKRVLGSVSPNVGLVLGLVSVLQGMLAVVFYHWLRLRGSLGPAPAVQGDVEPRSYGFWQGCLDHFMNPEGACRNSRRCPGRQH